MGGGKIFHYIFPVSKVFFILIIALFLPRLFLNFSHSSTYAGTSDKKNNFRLGLEGISSDLIKKIYKTTKSPNIGLVTNQTGKDQYGRRNIDILVKKGLHLKKIFTPEHGIEGTKLAEKEIIDSIDTKTKIPIISLYGKGRTKNFDKKSIEDLDILMFDIQDCGMRHYTYITALFQTMEIAAKNNKTVVVLDRPNLIGPLIEGPLVETKFKSDISAAPIPLRYGMTIGELALYYNTYLLKNKLDLHIVQMKNYKRNSPTNNKLLTLLSPNITNLKACHCYSFLGLLGEIKPFYVGVGTNKAFRCILLPENISFPKQKWKKIHKLLRSHKVYNRFYRHFDKKKKCYFSGLEIKIKDIFSLSSFNLLLTIIDSFIAEGLDITFSKSFNKAIGTDKVRNYLDGKIKKEDLEKEVNSQLDSFFTQASTCFLYTPFPKTEHLSLTS